MRVSEIVNIIHSKQTNKLIVKGKQRVTIRSNVLDLDRPEGERFPPSNNIQYNNSDNDDDNDNTLKFVKFLINGGNK